MGKCDGKGKNNARRGKIINIMEVVKGGKDKKESIKKAKERREKIGFKPRNKDVLIDIVVISPKSRASGIIMPDGKGADSLSIDSFWEHPFQGIVVAIGDNVASDISVGQKVAFRPPGNPVRDKNYTYALLSDYDIIGFL